MKIPKCMSTQHPDNVNVPFFAENAELGADDEIQEAYYAFSHLGCDEQMWDYEGKEVDNFVIKKLQTNYASFFKETRIGKDVFITIRVPNPTVEKAEAKILLETLESIPRSYDAAQIFNGDEIAPIFEVILPMVSSHRCLNRIYRYYTDFIIAKQYQPFRAGDITIREWVGDFKPERINVIPLFENKKSILGSKQITWEFIKDKKLEYQRVFLARSDPAMNYGLVPTIIIIKIALHNFQRLAEESGVSIYPIIGVGSAPFRGNLRPDTVERVSREYPSVHTFTIQSAFKYDNHPDEVRQAIKTLKERQVSDPQEIDDRRGLEIVKAYTNEYRNQIRALAPVINNISHYIPRRRKRKLHIGLFGYSRSVGGFSLPRAISFTAALYSIGVPPEILGLNALSADDLKYVRSIYVNFDQDIKDALRYVNLDNGFLPQELKSSPEKLALEIHLDEEHKELTDQIVQAVKENRMQNLANFILRCANIRRFLG